MQETHIFMSLIINSYGRKNDVLHINYIINQILKNNNNEKAQPYQITRHSTKLWQLKQYGIQTGTEKQTNGVTDQR